MYRYRSALARTRPRVILPSATTRTYTSGPTNPQTHPKGTHRSSPFPPPGSELSIDPAQGGVNPLVWVGALTAAAGGAYWYSTTSKGAAEKDKAEARAREMKAKASAKADEGKIKANELRVGHLQSFAPYLTPHDTCTDHSIRARQLRNMKASKPMHRRSMTRERVPLSTSTKRQKLK